MHILYFSGSSVGFSDEGRSIEREAWFYLISRLLNPQQPAPASRISETAAAGLVCHMGTILRVPIIRIIVFWGLDWVTSILGNHHVSDQSEVNATVISVFGRLVIGREQYPKSWPACFMGFMHFPDLLRHMEVVASWAD